MPKQTLYDELGQFTTIPEKVIEMIPIIGSDAALLYLYFRYRTNRERKAAWPGYDRMCKDLGWGRRRISNAIKALDDAELIERKIRYNKSTIYITKKPPDIGGEEDQTPSSSEMELVKNDKKNSSNRDMELKQSRSATKVVPKRDPNQIDLNQINPNQIEKDSSAKKTADNGRPPKPEYNRLRKLAEDTFYNITQCPELSNQKEKNKRVYTPLIEMLDLVEWREDDIVGLLHATNKRMKGLTFDAPDQWRKTARSIVAEAKRGTFKPAYSFENEMKEFLNQFGGDDGK